MVRSCMRRSQVQTSTTDQRLLDSRGSSDWVHTDPWRVLRIQSEFVEGFGMLAELGPAISVFGSARTQVDDPMYAKGVQLGRALVEAGYAVITGGGPGVMEAANKGASLGRGSLGRARHRAAVRGRPQRVGRHRDQLPVLLRPQDDVRQVRAGFRGDAWRLRHVRRAVRGVDAGPDAEGDLVPDRAARHVRTGPGCSTGSGDTVLAERKIDEQDLALLQVTDDVDEAVGFIAAADRRRSSPEPGAGEAPDATRPD